MPDHIILELLCWLSSHHKWVSTHCKCNYNYFKRSESQCYTRSHDKMARCKLHKREFSSNQTTTIHKTTQVMQQTKHEVEVQWNLYSRHPLTLNGGVNRVEKNHQFPSQILGRNLKLLQEGAICKCNSVAAIYSKMALLHRCCLEIKVSMYPTSVFKLLPERSVNK